MKAVPALLARGGSSRGLLLREADLAGMSEAERRTAFAFAVGSPDPDNRQVNGVGGGNATTSKVAVVSPSKRAGHDVDYAFYQMIVATGAAETRGTCGNLVAAVGQFAIENRLVAVNEPVTTVTIYDVNTTQTIAVDVPVTDGEVVYVGGHAIAGVPGTGAPVPVRFLRPGGRVTGRLLPSGQLSECHVVEGRAYDVSLIDAVNPVVLLHATSLAPDTPWDIVGIEKDDDLGHLMEHFRAWAAVRFDLASSEERAGTESPFLPFVGLYWDRRMSGAVPATIHPDPTADVSVRLMSGGLPHRAVPLSAGLATATLARLRSLAGGGSTTDGPVLVRLEHPNGLIELTVDATDDGADVRSVGVTQTARPIMQGQVFFP